MTMELPGPPADGGSAPDRSRQLWRGVLLACGLLIVAGLTVANLQLHERLGDRQDRGAAGKAALRVGGNATEDLLSYNYRTIDQDLSRAVDWTTGSFKKELQQLNKTVVHPTAVAKSVVTKTTVTHVGVARQASTTVELLVFATQVTSSAGVQPERSTTRLTVTMKRADGRWLVSALRPI